MKNTQVLNIIPIFNMFWITDAFSKGLTIGVLTGLSLHMIVKYIFRNKYKKPDKNSTHTYVHNSNSDGFTKVDGEFKMALLVRSDLKMGKGKVAAQVRYIL